MRNRLLFVAVCLATAALAAPSAQSDLDALMARVLERRDENWKKLQQYTLNERERCRSPPWSCSASSASSASTSGSRARGSSSAARSRRTA